MIALARARNMSPHHGSALKYKVNQLARFYQPSRWLDRRGFGEFALNFLAMGNGYLQRVDNLAGGPLRLVNSPALFTRAGKDGQYWWTPSARESAPFDPGSMFHLRETDLMQEIYGLPEYLSALQAGLLNFDATIFRRKYYLNGSHAGFILYVSEPTFDDADAEALETALSGAKGRGNFKNLLLHLPNGKEKGVQVVPLGEATAKDEFLGIKNTTRDDILAAHRVPPVLIGVVAQVAGGFGAPGQAADVFHAAEIEPLQLRMLEVNDWLGYEAVRFGPYEPLATAAPAA